MSLRKAAEMALEVMEAAIKSGDWVVDGVCDPDMALVALRQALTPKVTPEVATEVTEEVTEEVGACVTCGAPKGEWLVDAVNISVERVDKTAKGEHEPVAWFVQYEYRHEFLWRKPNELEQKTALEINPLYTAPPKREWVGLTEYQRLKFADGMHIPLKAVEKIEAKLKEKNSV